MMVTYKNCHEMLLYILQAYRTIVRTSTGETSYSLVYLEVQIPSLRVLMDVELENKNGQNWNLGSWI
jgi:hypothetical protein